METSEQTTSLRVRRGQKWKRFCQTLRRDWKITILWVEADVWYTDIQIRRVISKSKTVCHAEVRSNVMRKVLDRGKIHYWRSYSTWGFSLKTSFNTPGHIFKLEVNLIKYSHSLVIFAPVGLENHSNALKGLWYSLFRECLYSQEWLLCCGLSLLLHSLINSVCVCVCVCVCVFLVTPFLVHSNEVFLD